MVKRAENSVLTKTEPTKHRLGRSQLNPASWSMPRHISALLIGVLPLLKACSPPPLPDCAIGKAAPTQEQKEKIAEAVPSRQIDVAIDGSGSMLGLTGSPKTTATWKAMLKGVNLAAASTGIPIKPVRSGSGQLQPLRNISQAGEPCFFSDCGVYPTVSSSIDSLWKENRPRSKPMPLNVAISDLEVNGGEIDGLVSAITPYVDKGAVIGILAVKLPFEGNVYNSQGVVIHTGTSLRPIYMLATGEESQLKKFLSNVRRKAVLAGVPAEALHLTFLDEHVNRATLKAVSVQGVPPKAISSGLEIALGGTTYSPAGQPDYQFAHLSSQAKGIQLSSSATIGLADNKIPNLGFVQLEVVNLPGTNSTVSSTMYVNEVQLIGQQLLMNLSISPKTPAAAIRAIVPRGQLPEEWWINWDRRDPATSEAKNQTDGLLLLLTSLGELLVEEGATPAAAFCLAFTHSS